ncbi:MAG: hypothetical protein KA535_10305 [Azonexus sp.]|nr:hypothetical protein [Azonexus sp.]
MPDNQTWEEQQASLHRRLPDAGWHPTRFNPPFALTLLGVAPIANVSAIGHQEIEALLIDMPG